MGNSNDNIVAKLGVLLASTYTLYLKTQNFHWNVVGPFFQTLHLMFEGQYQELALANDEIAERIRALGAPAPGTYREFAKLSILDEPEGSMAANEMVKELLSDYEKLDGFTHSLITEASEAQDEGTVDLLTSRVAVGEKTAWMLRSFLE